jgi:hypothetical protein
MEGEDSEKLKVVAHITKKDAALAQLAAAIYIWFHHGDVISIHTLAAAAHDCFYWMAKHKEKESILRQWMKSQSKGLQKRIADAQNFFKHGHKWLTGKVKYPVIYGEMLMLDSVVCYGMAFSHGTTPLPLRLYAVRFSLENEGLLETDLARYYLTREEIDKLRPLSREDFYERGMILLDGRYRGLGDV